MNIGLISANAGMPRNAWGLRRSALTLLLCLLLALAPQLALAGAPAAPLAPSDSHVIYVDDSAGGNDDGSSWTDAFASLQSALDLASGDSSKTEIWVAAGTYYPSATSDGSDARSARFSLIGGLAIYGGFSGGESSLDERDWSSNEVVLSGNLDNQGIWEDNAYHVVVADGLDETALLDGVTIRGGFAKNGASTTGGGILVIGGAPSLNNLFVDDNHAEQGGGIYSDGASPLLYNVVLSDNTASSQGGGMYAQGGQPAISYCTFEHNYAESAGGGIYNQDSAPTIIHAGFYNNSAGVEAGVSSGSATSSSSGGGMQNENSNPLVANSRFLGNTAYYTGGAISNGSGSNGYYVNVLISGNTAGTYGGAIFNLAQPRLSNVTITSNSVLTTTATRSGGIYSIDTINISNAIIWGNQNGQVVNGLAIFPAYNAIVEYSLVQDGYAPGSHILTADPSFVDMDGPDDLAGTSDDDLRLDATSPALDAGSNSLVLTDTMDVDLDGDIDERVEIDLDGNARLVDSPASDTGSGPAPIVDLGVYERSVSLPSYRIYLPLLRS